MKKMITILITAVLCMGLSGCSIVGGISSSLLVIAAIGLLAVCAMRARSLARMRRRRRRMNRRQRAWLRRQIAMTDKVQMFAILLLIAGIIVGLLSFKAGRNDKPEVETLPPPQHAVQTDPTTGTDAPEPTDSTVSPGPTDPSEPTEPDLIGIPESLLELMEKNPEAADFVLNYYNRQPVETDLSQIDRSEGVPLFMQWDPRWGYEVYGGDVIAITGCAPTCVAMVGYYLTGDEKFTPDQMAEYAYQEGYYVREQGTKWTFIGEGVEALGLISTELPLSKSVVVRNLKAGNPIIAVVGPGDFTTTGHYIVLAGYEDGMIRVNDPNRRSNSERLWSYATLESQIRNLWAIQAG